MAVVRGEGMLGMCSAFFFQAYSNGHSELRFQILPQSRFAKNFAENRGAFFSADAGDCLPFELWSPR